MVSKEDFVEVWKDSSRESILNQFYYEHKLLQEEYNNWNELKEHFKKQTIDLEMNREDMSADHYVDRKSFLKEVLSKVEEIESRK